MGGTYAGAYSNSSGSLYNDHKKKKRIKIAKAKRIDVYHYHGSWFDYTWELTSITDITHTVETSVDYSEDQLVGKEILIIDGAFTLA